MDPAFVPEGDLGKAIAIHTAVEGEPENTADPPAPLLTSRVKHVPVDEHIPADLPLLRRHTKRKPPVPILPLHTGLCIIRVIMNAVHA